METLSKTTTSFMITEHEINNGTYPIGFVTIPEAEVLYSNVREEAGATVLGYSPTIQAEDFGLWEKYAAENSGWLWESMVAQARMDDARYEAQGISNQIWRIALYDEDGEELGKRFCAQCDWSRQSRRVLTILACRHRNP